MFEVKATTWYDYHIEVVLTEADGDTATANIPCKELRKRAGIWGTKEGDMSMSVFKWETLTEILEEDPKMGFGIGSEVGRLWYEASGKKKEVKDGKSLVAAVTFLRGAFFPRVLGFTMTPKEDYCV